MAERRVPCPLRVVWSREKLCTCMVCLYFCTVATEVERRIAQAARDGEPHRAETVAQPPLRLAATVLLLFSAAVATDGDDEWLHRRQRVHAESGAPTNSSGRALCSGGSAEPPPRPLCSAQRPSTRPLDVSRKNRDQQQQQQRILLSILLDFDMFRWLRTGQSMRAKSRGGRGRVHRFALVFFSFSFCCNHHACASSYSTAH